MPSGFILIFKNFNSHFHVFKFFLFFVISDDVEVIVASVNTAGT